ncbi:MAG: alpha/beta hydrolase [Rhodothalassiaceae bacterium]
MAADKAPLDPSAQSLLDKLAELGGPKLHQLDPAHARQAITLLGPLLNRDGPDLAETRPLTLPGAGNSEVTATLLRGRDAPAGCPLILYFHGGGFVLQELPGHVAACGALANAARAVVMAVDYRLAPEHPFPAAYDDALAAWRWAQGAAPALDAGPVFVAGDSAGGNLAAGIALAAREADAPAGQILIYPWIDLSRRYPSRDDFGEGYFLEDATIDWFFRHYVGSTDPTDPRVSPMQAGTLTGAAPALIVLAGQDPLADEGRAYAQRLQKAGVDCTLSVLEGQIHGFLNLAPTADASDDAIARIAAWVGARTG